MQTTTTSEAKIGERVHGVDLGKVDTKHLAKQLKRLGVETAKGEGAKSLVTRLAAYYQQHPPKEMTDACEICGGESDYALQACPFCGLDDSDTASHSPDRSSKALAARPSNGEIDRDLRGASELKAERDLDERVDEVNALKGSVVVSHWHLGKKIAEIYDTDLWRMRTEKGGDGKVKARWKTFDSFCHHELGMTPKNAHWLMDVSREFSEAQMRAFGPARLGLVLQLPEAAKEEALEELEERRREGKAMPKRELEEKVRKIKKETGFKRPGKGAHGGAREGAGKPKSEKITVAQLVGRWTHVMYKKPATRKWEEKDLAKAKRVADAPFCVRELPNNCTETFHLSTDAEGHLKLTVEIRRNEE